MPDLDPSTFGAAQPCFGCSPEHPIGFHLRFEREGDEIVTRLDAADSPVRGSSGSSQTRGLGGVQADDPAIPRTLRSDDVAPPRAQEP